MDYRALSKTLSHALRHEPDAYGIRLDSQGWTSIDELLRALRALKRWRAVELADLHTMMERADKQRFELDQSTGLIRAFYGHSISKKLEKQPQEPPEVLFHGTSPQVVDIILQEGLKPMTRQYVHHSADIETALQVGGRKDGKPTLLRINALDASRAGVSFYLGNEMVWLSEPVPPEFITVES